MDFIEKLDRTMRRRPWSVSLLLAAIAIYPQLVSMAMEWKMSSEYGKPFQYFTITPVKFCIIFAAALVCLIVNFWTIKTKTVWNLAKWDFLICLAVVPLFFLVVKGLRLHVPISSSWTYNPGHRCQR